MEYTYSYSHSTGLEIFITKPINSVKIRIVPSVAVLDILLSIRIIISDAGWEMTSLKGVFGPATESGVWGMKTNKKLDELCRTLDLVVDIKI
jgi:hypothetical protein